MRLHGTTHSTLIPCTFTHSLDDRGNPPSINSLRFILALRQCEWSVDRAEAKGRGPRRHDDKRGSLNKVWHCRDDHWANFAIRETLFPRIAAWNWLVVWRPRINPIDRPFDFNWLADSRPATAIPSPNDDVRLVGFSSFVVFLCISKPVRSRHRTPETENIGKETEEKTWSWRKGNDEELWSVERSELNPGSVGRIQCSYWLRSECLCLIQSNGFMWLQTDTNRATIILLCWWLDLTWHRVFRDNIHQATNPPFFLSLHYFLVSLFLQLSKEWGRGR